MAFDAEERPALQSEEDDHDAECNDNDGPPDIVLVLQGETDHGGEDRAEPRATHEARDPVLEAARLGARPVLGIDADSVSVKTSKENAQRWLDDLGQVSFSEASVLDGQQMASFGTFDVVYSWGVLHHTGNMQNAIEIAARSVKPSGQMMIAIYNQHWTSPIWKAIKWLYNYSGTVGQRVLTSLLLPVIFFAKWLVTGKNPRRMRRGMDFKHNIIDWVGGYPYEYASVGQIKKTLEGLGFRVIKIKPANVPTGCNEFIAQRV
jgi:2-polyprenyl-6-hydroxyphenyl methylase/3-demethylubiquinone-9 3-methyltransferase